MDPQFARAHLILAAYIERRMFAEALTDLDHARPIEPPAWYWANAAYVYGRFGQNKRAQQALHQLVQLDKDGKIDPMTLAQAYAGVNDREHAITWLEKAYAQHSSELVDLKVDPLYDEMRGDPRFQDLLRRVGLAQ
jgi:serine/threonine-protein kinase